MREDTDRLQRELDKSLLQKAVFLSRRVALRTAVRRAYLTAAHTRIDTSYVVPTVCVFVCVRVCPCVCLCVLFEGVRPSSKKDVSTARLLRMAATLIPGGNVGSPT